MSEAPEKAARAKCFRCGNLVYDGRPYYAHSDGTFECARLLDCYGPGLKPRNAPDNSHEDANS